MLPGLFIPFHRKGSGDMMSTFLSENKELLSEWDFEKNAELKLFPEKLTEGSNKKAWWKCKNGHTWQEPIYQRWQGKQCPFCTNKRVLVGYNDLPTLFPELAREWDAEENKNIDLLSVVPGSSKTVNWKCSVCGYKWKTSIRQRTQRKTGCPECAKAKRATARTKTILKHSGSVADFEIAKQWNHEKNIGLSPAQFSPFQQQIGMVEMSDLRVRMEGKNLQSCKSGTRLSRLCQPSSNPRQKRPGNFASGTGKRVASHGKRKPDAPTGKPRKRKEGVVALSART